MPLRRPHRQHQLSGRFYPRPFTGMYTASKHAVEGYTENLDREVRQFGVRAVLVQLSYTKNNINQNEKTAQTNLEAYLRAPSLRSRSTTGQRLPDRFGERCGRPANEPAERAALVEQRTA